MSEHLVLKGELLIGESTNVSTAISESNAYLLSKSEMFEKYFDDFGLKIEEWRSLETEETPMGCFVRVEANGHIEKGKERLMTFIQDHDADLYFNVNGFVPTEIVFPQKKRQRPILKSLIESR